MSKINIEDYNLRDLTEKFENRDFAIPEIQRQFVWKKPAICKLADSIFRNYPIGICLVWVAPYSSALHIRPNNKTIIFPFNKKAKKTDLIIDGQQRLSTVFGIIFGVEPRPEANSQINFKELFFDCDTKAEKRFIFSRRLTDDSYGYIRLHTLLTTQPAVLRRRLQLTKSQARQSEICYHAFHNYPFYVLEFEGLGNDDVKEIFIRINSGGMKASRADTLFARATNVNLRDHMIDTQRGLKNGFDLISVDALQNSLGLAYDATQIGNKAFDIFLKRIEKSKKGNQVFEKKWKQLQYGYEEAVDFLVNNLGVRKFELLPSQNIYSMLAFFFYLNKSRAKPNQIREIKKWFWHTACQDRYSGSGFNRNIPEDIRFFKRLANGNNAKYFISEKISPLEFLKTNYRNSRGTSSTNAYFIMLRSKKPKYLLNGQEMLLDDTSAISNRKDRHHIFPSALLRRKQVNAKWVNSIANICYLESDENQSISDNHPRIYLEEYKRKRQFSKVMRSHLIPYRASSPVWERNVRKGFLAFLNQRGKSIMTEIEKLAGAKLFEKFDSIKRI